MAKPMHQTAPPLRFDGAVDADGHILEPPDLWETYLEPAVPRPGAAVRRRRRTGSRQLEIGGQPSMMSRRGFPSTLGAMGDPDLRAIQHDPERTYLGEAPFGEHGPGRAAGAARRRGHRRRRPLHDRRPAVGGRARRPRAVARPTPGPTTAGSASSARAATGSCRPPTSRSAIRRPRPRSWSGPSARAPGARTWRRSPTTRRPLGHPDNDPVFAAAQDLDVPFAIHPTFEPQWTKGTRMGAWENVRKLRLLASVTASDGVRHQFTTLFDYGVFDRFPRLKVLVLESGGGWIGYWLDRIDAVYGHTFIGTRVPLEHKPSDYFRERVLDLVRSRRAHDPRPRRPLRRRPVPVGVGLPPRRPHARVPRRPRRAGRARSRRAATGAASSATTPERCSTSRRDIPGLLIQGRVGGRDR